MPKCATCGHGELYHNEADHCSLCHRKRINFNNTTCGSACVHPFVAVAGWTHVHGDGHCGMECVVEGRKK